METKNFHGNDNVEEIVTKAASAMADEIFAQRGDQETVENHDDTWYGVQEKLREGFLDVAFNVANADGEDYPKSDPRTYSVNDLLADVRKEVVAMFGGAMDSSDAEKLADTIADDVAEDVMETSDYPNYNISDIRIAIVRTLKKKLGIEE